MTTQICEQQHRDPTRAATETYVAQSSPTPLSPTSFHTLVRSLSATSCAVAEKNLRFPTPSSSILKERVEIRVSLPRNREGNKRRKARDEPANGLGLLVEDDLHSAPAEPDERGVAEERLEGRFEVGLSRRVFEARERTRPEVSFSGAEVRRDELSLRVGPTQPIAPNHQRREANSPEG